MKAKDTGGTLMDVVRIVMVMVMVMVMMMVIVLVEDGQRLLQRGAHR